jgi:MHS family proline/betaine transporter-like MFS transporter
MSTNNEVEPSQVTERLNINKERDLVRKRTRAVGAGIAGQILEWFDYGIYGTLAPILSSIFFPAKDPVISILLTLLVFGVGFVMRPLGSVIFGHVGDKHGRKIALAWTIGLMAVATACIGLIPSYASIGIAAPIILTGCRLIQGLATGGEWGAGTAFLVEYAKSKGRGFLGSWQQAGAVVGFMIGALVGFILTSTLSKASLNSWGWRIPFTVGSAFLGYIGWFIRTKIEDTPSFVEAEEKKRVLKNPVLTSLKDNWLGVLQAAGLSTGWNAGFYLVLSFMPTYIATTLKLPLNLALLTNLFTCMMFIILTPLMGHLSDKIGRKRVLFTSCFCYILFTYPIFAYMREGTFFKILIAQFVLCLFQSMYSGPGVAFIAEMFPTQVRMSTLIGYNVMAALAGGMGPFYCAYLVKVTHNSASPSYYMIAAIIVSLITIASLPETFDKPLR